MFEQAHEGAPKRRRILRSTAKNAINQDVSLAQRVESRRDDRQVVLGFGRQMVFDPIGRSAKGAVEFGKKRLQLWIADREEAAGRPVEQAIAAQFLYCIARSGPGQRQLAEVERIAEAIF
jgi:hypothetical protein